MVYRHYAFNTFLGYPYINLFIYNFKNGNPLEKINSFKCFKYQNSAVKQLSSFVIWNVEKYWLLHFFLKRGSGCNRVFPKKNSWMHKVCCMLLLVSDNIILMNVVNVCNIRIVKENFLRKMFYSPCYLNPRCSFVRVVVCFNESWIVKSNAIYVIFKLPMMKSCITDFTLHRPWDCPPLYGGIFCHCSYQSCDHLQISVVNLVV